eukprot:366577-Chlamydomonas_euryale.AAC.28
MSHAGYACVERNHAEWIKQWGGRHHKGTSTAGCSHNPIGRISVLGNDRPGVLAVGIVVLAGRCGQPTIAYDRPSPTHGGTSCLCAATPFS